MISSRFLQVLSHPFSLKKTVSFFAFFSLCFIAHSALARPLGLPLEAGDGVKTLKKLKVKGLKQDVLDLGLEAYARAVEMGVTDKPILTIIDYSKSSKVPRLWVLDLDKRKTLFRELVAHGRNSGKGKPTEFSDEPGSHASSLGVFLTGETYTGSKGYSLRLNGLEKGFNARARARAIVMHPAYYVSKDFIRKAGRPGESYGCFSLNPDRSQPVIDTIKDGSIVFAYYPHPQWLEKSAFLQGPEAPVQRTALAKSMPMPR